MTADPSRLAAVRGVQTDRAGLDAEQFDVAFETLRPRLLALARSLLGPETAEDAVQDTYVLGRESLGQLRDPAAVEAWLKRICAVSYTHLTLPTKA